MSYQNKTLEKCCDCYKTIWPWQRIGIDQSSHRKCHVKRLEKFLDNNPKTKPHIKTEIMRIIMFE